MRDWQVGDPIGDGNDIGVPDTKYRGYLRGDDEDDLADEFKWDLNHSRYLYYEEKYRDAFRWLRMAFGEYKKMSDLEKSRIRDEPFNRHWIIDLCCRMVNEHGDEVKNAMDVVVQNLLPVNFCLDCDFIYPANYNNCIRCGKELKKPYEKSPEKIAQEIPDAIRGIVFDEAKIQRIVDRSLVLMKSNGSRLVSIEDGRGFCTDFIFEKTHRYFRTRYACQYNPLNCDLLIFDEFSISHDYADLYAEESFIRLVRDTERKTGFKFSQCAGGFDAQMDDNWIDFIFNDKINVTVRFDVGDGRTAVYDLDLDNMSLSNDYRIY